MSYTQTFFRIIFYDARGVIIGAGLIASYCASFLFWRTPLIALAILLSVNIVLLLMLRSKKLLFIYIIGALLGTLMESQSTILGIWQYTIPDWRGIPMYLFAAWGGTTIFAIAAFKKAIGTNEHLLVPQNFHSALRLFAIAAFVTSLALWILWTLWTSPLIAALLLFLLGIFCISVLPARRAMLIVYVSTIFGGALSDLIGVPLGIWSYSVSTFHGIPLFMFFAWGLSGILFVMLYNLLAYVPFFRK